jgi:methanogenic corrinoid protein MtbC1
MERPRLNQASLRVGDWECWTDPATRAEGRAGTPRRAALAATPGADDPFARIARTIEAEVIPRLVVAHRPPAGDESAPNGVRSARAVAAADVREFTRIVLGADFPAAAGFVAKLRGEGVTPEAVCLDLLAPAARRLGSLWEEDSCDFTDVTLGLWRLQQMLRELRLPATGEQEARARGRRALLVPMPGEQHTFGLAMVIEFFSRAGWDVLGGPPGSVAELRQLVAVERFDLVGLSVSCADRMAAVAACIRTVRQASCNPDLAVMVGGRVFAENPELAPLVGADAMASDGQQAPRQAEQLLSLLGRARQG